MPKIIYIATSLDGRIADDLGEVGWLAPYETYDYGFDGFLRSIDLLVMGRTTYDQALGFGEWPYEGKIVLVMTHRPLINPPAGVHGIDGPLSGALARYAPEAATRVWLVGGSEVVAEALTSELVDELDIFVIPVILGAGVPLFADRLPPLKLEAAGHQTFPNGVQRLRYTIARQE